MRNAIYATFLLACVSTAAMAQSEPQRPVEAAPAAASPFQQREDWCRKYAAWFVERAPVEEPRATDVRPTQRIENEITYCKLDPQQYERETLAELAAQTRAS